MCEGVQFAADVYVRMCHCVHMACACVRERERGNKSGVIFYATCNLPTVFSTKHKWLLCCIPAFVQSQLHVAQTNERTNKQTNMQTQAIVLLPIQSQRPFHRSQGFVVGAAADLIEDPAGGTQGVIPVLGAQKTPSEKEKRKRLKWPFWSGLGFLSGRSGKFSVWFLVRAEWFVGCLGECWFVWPTSWCESSL